MNIRNRKGWFQTVSRHPGRCFNSSFGISSGPGVLLLLSEGDNILCFHKPGCPEISSVAACCTVNGMHWMHVTCRRSRTGFESNESIILLDGLPLTARAALPQAPACSGYSQQLSNGKLYLVDEKKSGEQAILFVKRHSFVGRRESQSADYIGQSVSQTGFWREPDAAFQQTRTGCTTSATRVQAIHFNFLRTASASSTALSNIHSCTDLKHTNIIAIWTF
ncbi:TPA: hypothetical protein ACH3X2_006823 [Trebouxia sp. C0005]